MKRILSLALVSMTLAACGDVARTDSRCVATTHGDWKNDCRSVYAVARDELFDGEEPLTHVFQFDGARFRVSVLITRARYERFFTNRPDTQVIIGTDQYVADPNFFYREEPAQMQIGGESFDLQWSGEPHLIAASGDSGRIRDALTTAGSETVTIDYTGTLDGRASVTIPVEGFSDAIAAWK